MLFVQHRQIMMPETQSEMRNWIFLFIDSMYIHSILFSQAQPKSSVLILTSTSSECFFFFFFKQV
jgi:hypothetical protein